MRGGSTYALFVSVVAVLGAPLACTKKEPCRPGTVYLDIAFASLAGQVTALEVRSRLAASDPWTLQTIENLATKERASIEIGFSRRYPVGDTLSIALAAIGSSGALGITLEENQRLSPGCTALNLTLERGDGGPGGAGGASGSGGSGGGAGGGGRGGAGGTGGTGGGSGGSTGSGGSGDISACPGKPRSHAAAWKVPNPPSTGLPNPHDYGVATLNAQTVVCDRVTGLMWHRPNTGGYVQRPWQEANDYCTDLDWAGFTDWRLPTRVELFSIVDYSRQYGTQSLDPAIFPGTPAEYFWTFSQDYTLPGAYWYIDFGSGESQVDIASQTAPSHWVRCVR